MCGGAPVLCPCGGRADSGRAVKTLPERPACVSDQSVGTKRSLGGGWLVLTCPGPLGLLQQNTANQAACGQKAYFSGSEGWKSKFELPQILGLVSPDSETAVFLLCPHVSAGVCHVTRARISITRASSS